MFKMLSDMSFFFSSEIMPSWDTIIKYFKNCDTFDNLWYILYIKKNKTLWCLPSSSNISHGHIHRSHYVILIYSNLILTPNTNFSPVEFGWNLIDSVLISSKCIVTLPMMYTVTCGYKKKCNGRSLCSKFGASCT